MKNENEKTSIETKKIEIKEDLESSTEKISCNYDSIKLEPKTLQWFAWVCSNAGYTGSLSDFINKSTQTLFTNHYKLDICVVSNSDEQIVAHEEDNESNTAVKDIVEALKVGFEAVKVQCPSCKGTFTANSNLASIHCPLCNEQLINDNQIAPSVPIQPQEIDSKAKDEDELDKYEKEHKTQYRQRLLKILKELDALE